MASLKEMRDNARNEHMRTLMEILADRGEEVLQTKSNTFAFPILLEDGTEDFLRVVVSIPTGTKTDPYNAYEEAEDYQLSCKLKAEKKAEAKAKKEAKVKADAEKRAKAKANHKKEDE